MDKRILSPMEALEAKLARARTQNARLRRQLQAAQKKADAAIRDMGRMAYAAPCVACKHYLRQADDCPLDACAYCWRGEKEEAAEDAMHK